MIIQGKSNTGLVEFCKKALNGKWGYTWGTWGQVLTDTIFIQKLNQYPSGVGRFKAFIKVNWLGRRTVDCVGLIKAYMWWQGKNPAYDRNTDVNADMMYNRAEERGTINFMPEVPGLCVWFPGHIGVYTGNGQVIEAKGTIYGVVQTPLTGDGANRWTHWLKCPYIEYKEDGMFKDVERTRWSYDYIKKAAELEFIKGNPDGNFYPTDNLTREEAATIAVRQYEKTIKHVKELIK